MIRGLFHFCETGNKEMRDFYVNMGKNNDRPAENAKTCVDYFIECIIRKRGGGGGGGWGYASSKTKTYQTRQSPQMPTVRFIAQSE